MKTFLIANRNMSVLGWFQCQLSLRFLFNTTFSLLSIMSCTSEELISLVVVYIESRKIYLCWFQLGPFFLLHAYTRCIAMGIFFSLPNSCICVHLVAKLFTFEITLLIEKLVNIGNVSSHCNCYHVFIHIALTFVAYQACSTTSRRGNKIW